MKRDDEIQMCSIVGITVPPNRIRKHLDNDAVSGLMESLSTIGLQTPITVTVDEHTGEATLIAGAHRLEAARRLGWDEIAAHCVTGWSENDARQWEIAENLHRAELTVLERDEHVAEWIKIEEVKIKEAKEKADLVSSQDATKLSKRGRDGEGRPESGTRAAARVLHIDKDDAHRATKVASLAPEAKEAAREAGLDDNRTALLEAARKTSPEEQVASIKERATARRVVTPANPEDTKPSKLDADVKKRCDIANAERAVQHMPWEVLEAFISDLFAAGHKSLAIEIKNLTGESVFDKGNA